MDQPDLTVIVVNYNTAHLLRQMFTALGRAAEGLHIQTIVIDNCSRDMSVSLLKLEYPEVSLIVSSVNIGFGRANNLAIPYILADKILLLNTDAFVSEDSLHRSIAFLDENPDVGILGAHLVGSDGSDQPSCRYFPTPLNTFLQGAGLDRFFPAICQVDADGLAPQVVRDCDWVPGCFYLTRRQVIEQCGLFDPRYFLYFEEVDHCRAVKSAGWRVVYFPGTKVVHLGGESAKSDGPLTAGGNQLSGLQAESEVLYLRKHHGLGGLALHTCLSLVMTVILCAKGAIKMLLLRRAGIVALKQPLAAQRLRMRMLLATRLGQAPLH